MATCAAARGAFQAIAPPPPVSGDVARVPVVVDDLGRIKGLFDVCHPALDYAIPCVFKPTGWVRQRLTAKEWLALHDTPVVLTESLEAHILARNSIALALTPLLAGWVVRSLWGIEGGEWRHKPRYRPLRWHSQRPTYNGTQEGIKRKLRLARLMPQW